MSGGIFTGYPFTLNIKCIIFSIIIMIIYTFRPPILSLGPSLLVYFLIFVISYVALAWYDYFYSCEQLPLFKSTGGGLTDYLKPKMHEPEKQKEHLFSQKEIDKNNITIYVLHILIIVPLLLYIGLKAQKTPKEAFYVLLVLSAFTAVYHGFRLLGTAHLKT
jgi:hypothetical protein